MCVRRNVGSYVVWSACVSVCMRGFPVCGVCVQLSCVTEVWLLACFVLSGVMRSFVYVGAYVVCGKRAWVRVVCVRDGVEA